MAVCAQNISSHAVQLMTSLNLQRERAQFCDCVVIQRLNPTQVFPAHRCVLSASSPVLASILSSTGALVELQDPRLSDSVLAMLLDYIYTGSMQYTHSREQYYSLLSAATYLQMHKLQETLKAWQHTEVDAAGETDESTGVDYQPDRHVREAHGTSRNNFRKHRLLFHSCTENSSQEEDNLPNVDICNEIDTGTDKQQDEMCREENMKQLSLELKSEIEGEQINSKKTDEADLIVKDDVPHSQRTSPSSSLSSLPCWEAVSVICHSSKALMPELTDNHVHCDLTENQSNSEPQNKLCRNIIRGLKNKTDLKFEDLPSKYQRLDSSDSHGASEKSVHSHDLRAAVPLPALNTNTGSYSHCEYLSPKGEVKDEHPYSKVFPTNVERQDSNCTLNRPLTEMCPHVQKAETSTNDYSFDICSCAPTTPETGQGNITGNPSVFERCTSLELEKIMSQMHVDSNTSDHESNVVWRSYHGHLQYHCMPQEDTHESDGDSDHKLSNPNHSDQASDEEEVSTYQDEEVLRKHFARQTTERVVLLDISATPAELLVTYKHRSEGGENQIEYDFKSRENTDKVQWDEATLAAVHEKKCTAPESFDGAETKSLFEEANVAERQSVRMHKSCPDPEDLQNAKATEFGNQAPTFTVCSQPPDLEFVRGSMAPTSPDFTPCTPSATVKANKSAPLSSPAQHPFKCYLCDRSFSQRGSLNRHVRSHLGVRPFPCPNCPMTFSRQYRVTEHMRVHQRCSLGTDFVKPSASPT